MYTSILRANSSCGSSIARKSESQREKTKNAIRTELFDNGLYSDHHDEAMKIAERLNQAMIDSNIMKEFAKEYKPNKGLWGKLVYIKNRLSFGLARSIAWQANQFGLNGNWVLNDKNKRIVEKFEDKNCLDADQIKLIGGTYNSNKNVDIKNIDKNNQPIEYLEKKLQLADERTLNFYKKSLGRIESINNPYLRGAAKFLTSMGASVLIGGALTAVNPALGLATGAIKAGYLESKRKTEFNVKNIGSDINSILKHSIESTKFKQGTDWLDTFRSNMAEASAADLVQARMFIKRMLKNKDVTGDLDGRLQMATLLGEIKNVINNKAASGNISVKEMIGKSKIDWVQKNSVNYNEREITDKFSTQSLRVFDFQKKIANKFLEGNIDRLSDTEYGKILDRQVSSDLMAILQSYKKPDGRIKLTKNEYDQVEKEITDNLTKAIQKLRDKKYASDLVNKSLYRIKNIEEKNKLISKRRWGQLWKNIKMGAIGGLSSLGMGFVMRKIAGLASESWHEVFGHANNVSAQGHSFGLSADAKASLGLADGVVEAKKNAVGTGYHPFESHEVVSGNHNFTIGNGNSLSEQQHQTVMDIAANVYDRKGNINLENLRSYCEHKNILYDKEIQELVSANHNYFKDPEKLRELLNHTGEGKVAYSAEHIADNFHDGENIKLHSAADTDSLDHGSEITGGVLNEHANNEGGYIIENHPDGDSHYELMSTYDQNLNIVDNHGNHLNVYPGSESSWYPESNSSANNLFVAITEYDDYKSVGNFLHNLGISPDTQVQGTGGETISQWLIENKGFYQGHKDIFDYIVYHDPEKAQLIKNFYLDKDNPDNWFDGCQDFWGYMGSKMGGSKPVLTEHNLPADSLTNDNFTYHESGTGSGFTTHTQSSGNIQSDNFPGPGFSESKAKSLFEQSTHNSSTPATNGSGQMQNDDFTAMNAVSNNPIQKAVDEKVKAVVDFHESKSYASNPKFQAYLEQRHPDVSAEKTQSLYHGDQYQPTSTPTNPPVSTNTGNDDFNYHSQSGSNSNDDFSYGEHNGNNNDDFNYQPGTESNLHPAEGGNDDFNGSMNHTEGYNGFNDLETKGIELNTHVQNENGTNGYNALEKEIEINDNSSHTEGAYNGWGDISNTNEVNIDTQSSIEPSGYNGFDEIEVGDEINI